MYWLTTKANKLGRYIRPRLVLFCKSYGSTYYFIRRPLVVLLSNILGI